VEEYQKKLPKSKSKNKNLKEKIKIKKVQVSRLLNYNE
jgi:hypothetical protein